MNFAFFVLVLLFVTTFGSTSATLTVVGAKAPTQSIGSIALNSPNAAIEQKNATFDVAHARVLFAAYLALLCNDSSVEQWNCTWCKIAGKKIDITGYVKNSFLKGETRGYVGTVNDTVMVFFQGSHDLPNWIYDFVFPLIPYPPVLQTWVHAGFFKAFQNIQAQVGALVKKAFATTCQNCTRIQVVGHSYGAALAVFQALDFVQNPPVMSAPKVQLTNFGCPRVGDVGFANYVRNAIADANSTLVNYWRVTHLGDPVPHVPIELMGFHHAGIEIYNYVHNGTETRICNGSGEDPTCSDSNLVLDPYDHLLYLGYDGHFGPHKCPYHPN